MAPQQKRVAGQPAAGMPDAKRRVASLLKQQGLSAETYRSVAEAMDHPVAAEHFSEGCRRMLAAMFPFALCVPSDLRGESQVACVSMVGDVLHCVEATLKEAVAEEVGQCAANGAQKTVLEGAVADAEANRTVVGAVVNVCEQAVKEASATLSEKQHVLGERQHEETRAAEEHGQRVSSRSGFENLLAGSVSALQLRAGEAGECEHFLAVAEELGLDESLVIALPTAVGKEPDDRGPFYQLLLDQFASKVQSKIAALCSQIEVEDAAAVERAQAIKASQIEVEGAASAKAVAEGRLQAATKDDEQAKAKVVAAQATVAEQSQRCARALEARCVREKELEAFRGTGLAAYVHLRGRVSAKRALELTAEAPGQALEATSAAQAGA